MPFQPRIAARQTCWRTGPVPSDVNVFRPFLPIAQLGDEPLDALSREHTLITWSARRFRSWPRSTPAPAASQSAVECRSLSFVGVACEKPSCVRSRLRAWRASPGCVTLARWPRATAARASRWIPSSTVASRRESPGESCELEGLPGHGNLHRLPRPERSLARRGSRPLRHTATRLVDVAARGRRSTRLVLAPDGRGSGTAVPRPRRGHERLPALRDDHG